MKLVPSAKRPCRLERGEIRRVPQDRANLLVGYHVCCLRCGFNTPALAGNDGLDIDEGDGADGVGVANPDATLGRVASALGGVAVYACSSFSA